MTTNYIEQINNLISTREQFIEIENKYIKLFEETKNDVGLFLEQNVKAFSLDKKLKIYFMSHGTPHFLVSYISDKNISWLDKSGWIFIEGAWVKTKEVPNGTNVYYNKLNFSAKLEQSILDNFKGLCRNLKEKTGLEVIHKKYFLVTAKNITIPKNEDELLLLHPNSTIVASGKKLHVGWDISDPWTILRTKKSNFVIYYSTNSHGFGYDKKVMPNESINEFFDFIEEPERVLPEKLYIILNKRYNNEISH